MLKIKDSVDLKELEKFGFYKSGGVYQNNLEYDELKAQGKINNAASKNEGME